MGLFKSKPKRKVTSTDQAVLDLKVSRDKLRMYQKKCNVMVERETQIARELLAAGKKKQALTALRKKRYQENLLEQSQGQLDNVQRLIDTVENAQMEVQIVEALRAGNASLKKLQDEIGGVEAVEELLLDTEDAIRTQHEIDEALSQQLTAEDEDEILAELDALEAEEAAETAAQMPDAPSTKLPTAAAAATTTTTTTTTTTSTAAAAASAGVERVAVAAT